MGSAKQYDIERMMKPALSDAQWERLLAFGDEAPPGVIVPVEKEK